MNLTTAINVFLRQSLRAGGFPFEVRLEQPNLEKMWIRDRVWRIRSMAAMGGCTWFAQRV